MNEWRTMRDKICLLFSIFIFSTCSSSPDEAISGNGSTADTSYYIPKDVSSIARARIDTVEISDMRFLPAVLTVRKGDTVIWINRDMVPHCITEEDSKAWSSLPVPAGASWKMAVTQNSNYYCAIHMVMKGRIAIEDSASASIQKLHAQE